MLLQEMVRRIKVYLEDQKGQGLAEYALILVLISVAAILTMGPLGDQIAAVFTQIKNELLGV